jgi:hypothetical protein
MAYKKHLGPRAEHRLREKERVDASQPIASRFPELKSLAVELDFHNRGGANNGSVVRYNVNVQNAKSVFRFDCPNPECIGGDFDLSTELANAITQHQASVSGDTSCQGWLSKHSIGNRRCEHRLSFRIDLTYTAEAASSKST